MVQTLLLRLLHWACTADPQYIALQKNNTQRDSNGSISLLYQSIHRTLQSITFIATSYFKSSNNKTNITGTEMLPYKRQPTVKSMVQTLMLCLLRWACTADCQKVLVYQASRPPASVEPPATSDHLCTPEEGKGKNVLLHLHSGTLMKDQFDERSLS